MNGADFLCYVTPAEHLGLPDVDDIRAGVIAARIAAHAADIVRLGAPARAQDDAMARARAALDWDGQFRLAIDPEHARSRHRPGSDEQTACSMCGRYCVFSLLGRSSASQT
jgi:phosphomethylpyrimidine synthase